jgi:hypothetical protein
MWNDGHYEAWHLESWNNDKRIEKQNVSFGDALAEDGAMMVILFSAFIAPNAMFRASHFIHWADHAQRSFLVVAVLLVLEDRSWVDDT